MIFFILNFFPPNLRKLSNLICFQARGRIVPPAPEKSIIGQ